MLENNFTSAHTKIDKQHSDAAQLSGPFLLSLLNEGDDGTWNVVSDLITYFHISHDANTRSWYSDVSQCVRYQSHD